MTKKHLKRLAAPRTWPISRKITKFIARPQPGAHSLKFGIPLEVLLKEILKLVKTRKEVNYVLKNKGVFVDGVKKEERRVIVGLMDSLGIKEINEYFRVVINKKGELSLLKITGEESEKKICKIQGKALVRGVVQLNLHDGRNILVKEDKYKTGDSILINVPQQEIIEHLKLEPGSLVYLIGGKNVGGVFKVEEIRGRTIKIKSKDQTIETLKKYAFVVGKEKSRIIIPE